MLSNFEYLKLAKKQLEIEKKSADIYNLLKYSRKIKAFYTKYPRLTTQILSGRKIDKNTKCRYKKIGVII